jgi:hypothetical protein
MAATQVATRPIHCDGCTIQATAEHLRRRIVRLEWASRFRPIHISTLILTPMPPAALEDDFYYPGDLPREPAARALFEDLLGACGIATTAKSRESALRQFQHRGLFVAEAVECPVAPEGETGFDELLARLTPTLARRVSFSYRPKSVLLLSDRLNRVARTLDDRSGAELLLWKGAPVALADPSQDGARQRFRAQVSSLLSGADGVDG